MNVSLNELGQRRFVVIGITLVLIGIVGAVGAYFLKSKDQTPLKAELTFSRMSGELQKDDQGYVLMAQNQPVVIKPKDSGLDEQLAELVSQEVSLDGFIHPLNSDVFVAMSIGYTETELGSSFSANDIAHAAAFWQVAGYLDTQPFAACYKESLGEMFIDDVRQKRLVFVNKLQAQKVYECHGQLENRDAGWLQPFSQVQATGEIRKATTIEGLFEVVIDNTVYVVINSQVAKVQTELQKYLGQSQPIEGYLLEFDDTAEDRQLILTKVGDSGTVDPTILERTDDGQTVYRRDQ